MRSVLFDVTHADNKHGPGGYKYPNRRFSRLLSASPWMGKGPPSSQGAWHCRCSLFNDGISDWSDVICSKLHVWCMIWRRQLMARHLEKRIVKASSRKELGSNTSIRMDDVSVLFEVRNEYCNLGCNADPGCT